MWSTYKIQKFALLASIFAVITTVVSIKVGDFSLGLLLTSVGCVIAYKLALIIQGR